MRQVPVEQGVVSWTKREILRCIVRIPLLHIATSICSDRTAKGGFLMKNSWKEFKNTRSLTTMALLLALTIVLGYLTISIGDFLKIGFSALPNELVSFLFGPAVGAVFGGLADILNFIVKPTGVFFPGFTISGILSGLIYGLVLYKKPLKIFRIVIANVIVAFLVNIILNTYWLTILYGTGFFAIFPGRVVKELVICVINSILMYVLCNTLKAAAVNYNL